MKFSATKNTFTPKNTMRKRIGIVLLLAGMISTMQAQQVFTLNAPKTPLQVRVECAKDGALRYSINYKGTGVVLPSRLGFSLAKPKTELAVFNIERADSSLHDDTWTPVWGEVASIRNHYRELKLSLRERASKIQVNVVFRVFDDGLGFRYEFPAQTGLKHFIIKEENTQFALAADNKTFWIPGDYDTNEYLYNTTKLSEIDALSAAAKEKDIAVQALIGPTAVQTPLMMKTPNGVYINIHEAALLNYAAMNLVLDKTTRTFSSHLVPDAVGNKGYLETPAQTPWRTIIVSDKATDILASKTILNLNTPPHFDDMEWIKPQKFIGVWWEMHIGKGNWFLEGNKHAANTANVKKYLDFAAKHGFDGVLVEGWNVGWEDWFGNWKEDVFDFVTPYPDYEMAELTRYARQKGVRLIMHHETSGSVTNYERRLDEAFQYMVKNDINTVKTGYVGKIIPRGEHHDGQWMNRHYAYVAEKAAKYKLMVEAHEPSHPTGLHRTFPNWLANEAARGNEFNNAPALGITPEHQTILPFTRLMGGPMDFTPGLFHFKLNEFEPSRTTVVRTTLVKQLALYVTMYSPLQMAGDLPEHYEKYPDAFQFIKDVAVDWSDSRYLEAEPGDFVVVARKAKGKEEWFVGGITDENARNADVKFDFLPPGKTFVATIYMDGPSADWDKNPTDYQIVQAQVDRNTVRTIKMAASGGFAIKILLQ